MGAGLQQNLGKAWGPMVWSDMIVSMPNTIFVDVANTMHKETERTSRRNPRTNLKKIGEKASMHTQTTVHRHERRIYSRHNNVTYPDEVVEDVPSQYSEELKGACLQNKGQGVKRRLLLLRILENVEVSMGRGEKSTSNSVYSGITVENKYHQKKQESGGNTLRGSQATRYGKLMETKSRLEYKNYQEERGHQHNYHPDRTCHFCETSLASSESR